MPIPRGGGARLAEALVRLVRDHGGVCRSETEVASIGSAADARVAVRTRAGERIAARRAVIANVTPTQLYGAPARRTAARAPRRRAASATGARRCRSTSPSPQPPRWRGDERLAQTAIVHLTPGLDGVSRAVNEAERGLLPAEATVVCGQPLTIDPSRAPAGAGLLWIQLQELPWRVRGDAAGEHRRRRRQLERGAARGLRRPDPGAARPRTSRTSTARSCGASRSPPPTSAARTRNLEQRRPLRRGRSRSTRTSSGGRFPGQPGHRTAGRGALADRGEHLARARSGRRVGDARGGRAPRPSPSGGSRRRPGAAPPG